MTKKKWARSPEALAKHKARTAEAKRIERAQCERFWFLLEAAYDSTGSFSKLSKISGWNDSTLRDWHRRVTIPHAERRSKFEAWAEGWLK